MQETQNSQEDTKAALARLKAALREERAARTRAQAENNTKSQLLAKIDQEIRTPASAILSMVESLTGTPLDEGQRRYVNSMERSGQALISVLNEVLDYSRIETGDITLDEAPIDTAQFLEQVRYDLEQSGREIGLATSVLVAEGFPDQVVADTARLRQIIDTLTENALAMTDQGSVRVLAGYGHDGEETILRFEVRDTGIGLTGDQIKVLFKPFSPNTNTEDMRRGASALALSNTRSLAGLMGGSLGCTSKPGHGSTFHFTVRLKRQQQPRKQETAEQPKPLANANDAAPASAPTLKGHILVAEDNEINQQLISAFIDQFGVTHDIACTGADAVTMVKQKPYDAVLMDIMMPEMDGLEAARRIRALESSAAKVPLIALTANAMKGDKEKYLAAGMDGYVSKPLSAENLYSVLSEHLT